MFLHGDSVVVHEINDKTGEYKKTEIGSHTNIFVNVQKPGKVVIA